MCYRFDISKSTAPFLALMGIPTEPRVLQCIPTAAACVLFFVSTFCLLSLCDSVFVSAQTEGDTGYDYMDAYDYDYDEEQG